MLTPEAFYYGRRQVITYDRTAQPTYHYTPLTQADFLDPQPTDEFAHSPRHDADVAYLMGIFRHHYRGNPLVTLLHKAKMIWDVEGIAQPAPDLAVAIGVESWASEPTQFDVRAAGQRPRFVLEVVSPRFVEADRVDKVQIYEQAGVQEYFVVDSGERADATTLHYQIWGYRLVKQQYQPIPPDATGRVYSKVNRLWLMVNPAGDGVTAMSERTGQPIIPDADSLTSVAAARAEATFRATSIAAQLNFLQGDSNPWERKE
ncbi:MAG: Uma2 family endonuclease [Caldilineaceae bacterium]|nr:Uma2 family endonuclease [Caldilineaceae bacterium]